MQHSLNIKQANRSSSEQYLSSCDMYMICKALVNRSASNIPVTHIYVYLNSLVICAGNLIHVAESVIL